MRRVKNVVVHCTATEDSKDFGFRDIDEWHRQRGWLSDSGVSCGYHWVVRRDGRVERGRLESESGAHVAGHNKDTIGVVWVGIKQIGFQQRKQLLKLLRDIIDRHGLSSLDVNGHNEYPGVKKECPVIDMDKLRADLLFELGDSNG